MTFGDPDQRHPKCYLRNLGGCKGKLTNEHLMPDAFDLMPGNRLYYEGYEIEDPFPHAVEKKCLCEKHNSEYGAKIDQSGVLYQQFIKSIFTEHAYSNLILCGHDLESFLIQRLCVHHVGGFFSVLGKSLKSASLDMKIVETALTENKLPPGGGLYITETPLQSHLNSNTVERTVLYNPVGNDIVGIRMTINEISVALMLHGRHPTHFGLSHYRPKGIRMVYPDGKASTVYFSWEGGASSPIATYRALPQ